MRRRRRTALGKGGRRLPVVALLLVITACSGGGPAAGTAARAAPLLARVDPFIGTENVSGYQGGHTTPAAAVPFGMVAFGPDTSQLQPGGYDYDLPAVAGFSLTHLSGAGCPGFGDFPLLPVLGRPSGDPGDTGQDEPIGFRHADESASPGSYAVRLDSGVRVQLTATARTAVGRFRFPAGRVGSLLIDASGSTTGAEAAQLTVVGHRVTGWVTSGHFCGTPYTYRLYLAGLISGPVTRTGVWRGSAISTGPAAVPRSVRQRGARAAGVGGFAVFRPGATVTVRLGLSYVSVAGAERNLSAESLHRTVGQVRAAARAAWAGLLSRVSVHGGSAAARTVFATALYHALLDPSVASDVDGAYRLPDGALARAAPGHAYYTDFSGWDLYRAQAPLLAVLAPRVAGDVAASMVADARAMGAFDRWTFAGGYTGVMVGDPYAVVIADDEAFGARDFPAAEALRLLVRGATVPAGPRARWVERPGLAAFLRYGYVPSGEPQHGPGARGWAATSLEYDTDDAALAAFAAALGHPAEARRLAAAARGWRRLFDPATGYIEPRSAAGRFPAHFSPTGRGGFVEGDAAQYTFAVPFDLPGLVRALGGPAATRRRLGRLFRRLAGGLSSPNADLGNEPSIGLPWVYDAAGDPAAAGAVVRRAAAELWRDSPAGEPGDDDLGAMSAWYVWAALGLYPEVPGRAVLALSPPLFRSASLRLADGRWLRVSSSPAASPSRQAGGAGVTISFDGRRLAAPWLPASAVTTGGTVRFDRADAR